VRLLSGALLTFDFFYCKTTSLAEQARLIQYSRRRRKDPPLRVIVEILLIVILQKLLSDITL